MIFQEVVGLQHAPDVQGVHLGQGQHGQANPELIKIFLNIFFYQTIVLLSA